jgi:hypothetical protein
MRKGIVVILCVVLFCGCAKFEQKRLSGVAVEYNGATVTYADLDALTYGLSSKDSARVADSYIQQWATSLIVYDRSKEIKSREIDEMVENYRRSLCQHEWERKQIAQKMPMLIEDSLVLEFYEQNKQHFILDRAILRGLLLIMPVGAPNLEKLKDMVEVPHEEENIEWVEKYAYQYAVGYELFLDDWKTVEQIAVYMPYSQDELSKQIKQKKQILAQDSLNVYLLQVTDFCGKGEYKPLEYVQDEIKELILSQRQVEFIRLLREDLYEKAVQQGKLKRYEK